MREVEVLLNVLQAGKRPSVIGRERKRLQLEQRRNRRARRQQLEALDQGRPARKLDAEGAAGFLPMLRCLVHKRAELERHHAVHLPAAVWKGPRAWGHNVGDDVRHGEVVQSAGVVRIAALVLVQMLRDALSILRSAAQDGFREVDRETAADGRRRITQILQARGGRVGVHLLRLHEHLEQGVVVATEIKRPGGHVQPAVELGEAPDRVRNRSLLRIRMGQRSGGHRIRVLQVLAETRLLRRDLQEGPFEPLHGQRDFHLLGHADERPVAVPQARVVAELTRDAGNERRQLVALDGQ
mmetsp:Transcript_15470/g.58837  ORF Transcript_15470/g.58837 Transcript_15470/m.58837 type:complete len:297 (-) Transcript_15470:1009-1899(-)